MNRTNIAYWTLYDFANSLVVIVFFLYFSQWLVVENGMSDFWYNMLYVGGSVMLLLSAPVYGAIADKTGRQHRYLNRITWLTFLFFAATALVTLFWSNQVILAAVLFMIANYLYQFSFVFYNAILHFIAPLNKQARISGVGQAGNWLGQIAGLLLTLPLVGGVWYLFGEPGRAQTFLPATIVFLFLSLPMMYLFKLPAGTVTNEATHFKYRHELKEQWMHLKDLLKVPGMKWFLLAYFFFNDAIITMSNNFAIYLEKVFEVSDAAKSMLLMSVLLTSALGAVAGGYIAEKWGLYKTLMLILASWVATMPIVALITDFRIFVIISIVVGILFGGTWTVTRAAMLALCPKDKLNFGFSFYTLAERVATFAGPVSWGVITAALSGYGAIRYRIAMVSLSVFVIIGIFLLRKIPREVDLH